jgi:uncharacterized membrane protein YjjP (DUF1212 family)
VSPPVSSPARALPVVAAAGELLLCSGAEVARVEDTLMRIAQAYGITAAEIYATPTGLFVTLGAEHLTTVRRIVGRTIALDRVSAVNALSRELAASPLDPDVALARIAAIAKQPGPVPAWADPIFAALSAAAATMLMGGVLSDFGPALLANAIVQWVQRTVVSLQLPDAIADFSAGFAAALCALAATTWLGAQFLPLISGGIMILVPGIAFTTAVRDAMAGDLNSATAKGLEAGLKVASLATGVASGLFVTGRF